MFAPQEIEHMHNHRPLNDYIEFNIVRLLTNSPKREHLHKVLKLVRPHTTSDEGYTLGESKHQALPSDSTCNIRS